MNFRSSLNPLLYILYILSDVENKTPRHNGLIHIRYTVWANRGYQIIKNSNKNLDQSLLRIEAKISEGRA